MSVFVSHGLFGRDLLLNLDLDSGLTTLVDNLEGEVLHVTLNILVVELAADQTLDVVDGSLGVGCVLVLGCADCQRVCVKDWSHACLPASPTSLSSSFQAT
jgi:hypothetical protein